MTDEARAKRFQQAKAKLAELHASLDYAATHLRQCELEGLRVMGLAFAQWAAESLFEVVDEFAALLTDASPETPHQQVQEDLTRVDGERRAAGPTGSTAPSKETFPR